MPKSPLSPEQLKAYRDQVVNVLHQQIELLEEIQQSEVIKNSSHTEQEPGQAGTASAHALTVDDIERKKPVIVNEIEKLKHFDVVLSVVGTMKAGKSTTINAIVGREIMPNRNRPMTALPTRIIHTPGQKQPVLVFENASVFQFAQDLGALLRDNPDWKQIDEIKENHDLQELIAALQNEGAALFRQKHEGDEQIFEFLKQLNDLVRLSEMLHREIGAEPLLFPYEDCRNINHLPTIEVEFSHLKNSGGVEGRLVLLDTPGPNESGQAHLKPMLAEQLQRSSAVLLVLDYTQLKSEAEFGVREQLAQIPALDKDRLFALVNKFDEKDANSDDKEQTQNMIFSDLLKDRIEKEHIFPVSSRLCYLANRMEEELAAKGKPALGGWVDDFAKEAFGALYARTWSKKDDEEFAEAIDYLREVSHMAEPIDCAIVKTQTEAPLIAIRSALNQTREVLQEVTNFCHIHIGAAKERTADEHKKLEEQIGKLENSIVSLAQLQEGQRKKLEKLCGNTRKKINSKINSLKNKIYEDIRSLFDQTQQNIEDELSANTVSLRDYLTTVQTTANLKKMKQRKAEMKALLKFSSGDQFALDKTEFNKFTKVLNEQKQLLVESANTGAQAIMTEGQKEIQAAWKIAQEVCEQELTNIKKGFAEHDVALELVVPDLEQFEHLDSRKVRYKRRMKKEEETYQYEQSGLWAKFKRFLSVGGYGTDTYTQYTGSKKEILSGIQADLDRQVFTPMKTQVDQKFGDYSARFIENYIGAVKRQAESLQQEFQRAIAANKLEGEEKQRYQQFVHELNIRNTVIQDTLQDCYAVFSIQEQREEQA
ncbi:GTPase SAR1 family protein [Neisseria sp. HSC-16F19]|nr:dynamin family protein [Neisseria sp. HSC-16F19]MCP2039895.1 GTPase SAR1 family protein [Neisseria sp. HSC-16F19]